MIEDDGGWDRKCEGKWAEFDNIADVCKEPRMRMRMAAASRVLQVPHQHHYFPYPDYVISRKDSQKLLILCQVMIHDNYPVSGVSTGLPMAQSLESSLVSPVSGVSIGLPSLWSLHWSPQSP